MSIPLACADFTFPLLSHDDVLRLVSMLKFDGIDIGLFEERSHLRPSKEFVNPERSGRELKKKTDDLGLKVADLFLQMSPDFAPYAINQPDASARQMARDWFLKTLDYASASGCHHVTALPGVTFDSESSDVSVARSIDELTWRVEQSKRRGITFGTECHVGSIAPEPSLAKRLAENVPGLTLTLDYTHFTRTGFSDRDIEPLLEHAGHFHVRGAAKGRLQTNFKNNVIDYAHVVERLRASNYKGWIGVEYVWIDWEHCNECDNISETIQFKDFLRSLPGVVKPT